MPQMKPMNWIILFTLLNLIMMKMNIKNYYMKNMMMKMKTTTKIYENKNWKW